MKILFLADNFPPEVNAAASRVYERALYWARWGHEVTIVTSAPNFPQGKVYEGYKNKWYQVENLHGLRVVRVKTFIAPNKGAFFRILDFLSYMCTSFFAGLFQKRPDFVVASSPQFFTAVSGWALSKVMRAPFIFEVADLWPDSIRAVGAMKESWFLNAMEKLELFLYRQAKSIIVLTPAFKENLVSRGIPGSKIDIIINGVEVSQFYPVKPDEALQVAHGLRGKFVVAYIGTFGMAHALSNVIEAAKRLQDRPEICFLFVGDGAERKMLEEKSAGLPNVTFLPPQKKQDIIHFWGVSDIALVHLKNNPVFETVIPSKIFEAMAMHKPILMAVPEGQATEIIDASGTGVCVPPESPEALADAVVSLYEDKVLRDKLKCKCAESVVNYTREAQAMQWISALTEDEIGERVYE